MEEKRRKHPAEEMTQEKRVQEAQPQKTPALANQPQEEELQEKLSQEDRTKNKVSETWAEETIADLDDFIESQGIYIRQ